MAFRTITDNILIGDGPVRTFTAKEAIIKGQVVEADAGADRGVEPSDADNAANTIGVALYSASTGEEVAVAQDGCIVRFTSGDGNISAGDLLATYGATGEEGEVIAATTGQNVVGRALKDDAGTNDDAIGIVMTHGTAA